MARINLMLLQSAGVLLLTLHLGACSTTETVSNFLSSTTPGDWYTRDGLPKAEHKVDVFLAMNLNNVLADAAKGQGEYLDSLGRLLDVDPSGQTRFAVALQEQYLLLVGKDSMEVGRTVVAVAHAVR